MRSERDAVKLKAYIDKYKLKDIFVPEVEKGASLFHYEKGEMVMRSGEPVNHFTILAAGKLRVFSVSEAGKMISIAVEDPPSLFGDIEILLKRDTLHNVVAETAVTLIAIPMTLTEQYLENNVAFYKLACSSTIEKLFRSSTSYSFTLLYPAKNRLARYFLDQGNGELLYHKNKLAEHFGITPRHLGRLLGEMEKEGMVLRTGRGRLQVMDAAELKKLAVYQ